MISLFILDTWTSEHLLKRLSCPPQISDRGTNVNPYIVLHAGPVEAMKRPMAFESFPCFVWLPWLIYPLTFTRSDFTSAQWLQSSHNIDWLTRCGLADVSTCWCRRCVLLTSFYVGWVTAGLDSHTSKVCGRTKSSPDLEDELIM